MSNSKDIPILNRATGEVSVGQSLSSQKPKKLERIANTNGSESPNRAVDNESDKDKSTATDEAEQIVDSSEEQSPKKQKSKKSAKQEIRSLSQFIEYAYSRKGQRISGTFNKVEKAICQDYILSPDNLAQLLEYAKNDILLAVPKELLLVSRNIVGYPRVKSEIRSFVEKVLKNHYLFLEPELALVLNNHPDAFTPEQALNKLAQATLPSSAEPADEISNKNLDQQVLRINAVYCLAVWFVETRAFSIEKITQMINIALWMPSISEAMDETAKLKALTEIRDIEGVGLVYAILKKETDRNAALAEKANRNQENLIEQINCLNDEIDKLKLTQQENIAKVQNLVSELESEKNAHAHARIHLGDDKEHLRARVLRRLKTEVSLLEEGLHALRRDPPKIHVMDDHAERALDGLYKEIKELESED
jgi:hypothetical protein